MIATSSRLLASCSVKCPGSCLDIQSRPWISGFFVMAAGEWTIGAVLADGADVCGGAGSADDCGDSGEGAGSFPGAGAVAGGGAGGGAGGEIDGSLEWAGAFDSGKGVVISVRAGGGCSAAGGGVTVASAGS